MIRTTAEENTLKKIECTGVILAGGTNSRLPGKKKTFYRVGEASMLEKLSALFETLFDEVILVVNDPGAFAGADAMVVRDIIPARCALAGLHAGLFYASNPWIYATACDVPFANEKIIRHLWGARAKGKEIVIPRTREGLEPLSAFYNKSCIPRIEKSLADNIFMIKRFFKAKKVREIAPEALEKLDPQMRFKFNVNTPEDLAVARAMAGNKG
ncbi:MAG: molybdenum cofactor guanylyltransferase [Desulfobacter sp.]|nr:MAG: molybdenum cofactor guanylyltransferase [Desulfobacter sp.]